MPDREHMNRVREFSRKQRREEERKKGARDAERGLPPRPPENEQYRRDYERAYYGDEETP